jgi:hypothetical protein
MRLWHRAPREVYRVYGEDQYREAEPALDGETFAREDTTTAEPDSRAEAPWVAFAAEAPSASLGTAGSSSARLSGSHAGRLIGLGLLVGVVLATLALVFLNMSHRHGAAPEPVGQGIRVEAEEGAQSATGVGRVQAIAHRVNSKHAQVRNFSDPPVRMPIRVSGSTLQHRAPAGGGSDTALRLERAWIAALRAPGDEASATVAGEPRAQVAVEPPVQDEFGFEQ